MFYRTQDRCLVKVRSVPSVTGFWHFERVESGGRLVGGCSKLLGEFESLLAAG